MGDNKIFADMGEAGKGKKKNPKSEITRIILVVGIIALLAWNIFFVEWGDPNVDEPIPEIEAQQTDIPQDSGMAMEERQEPVYDEQQEQSYAEDDGGGSQARTVISLARNTAAPPSNEELFTKAENYLQDGKVADAYILYFFLVKQGHGPSAMKLAEMADPNHRDPNYSFYDKPDFHQAHKWYVQALMLGEDKADRRLAELKLRVKAAATSGDERAKRLLVGW